MSPSGDERRRDARIAVNAEFRSIEEFVSEYVSDVSRTGVFVRTDDPLPIGTKVDLRFTIIADDFEVIEGVGEVTRIVSGGATAQSGMGVAFVELTPQSQRLLEQILGAKPIVRE